jgi:hypothetical protein
MMPKSHLLQWQQSFNRKLQHAKVPYMHPISSQRFLNRGDSAAAHLLVLVV